MGNNDITHDGYTDRLSDFIDGELDSREHGEVEQHVAQCASCRAMVVELRAVAERAASLPDRGPDRDLWNHIGEQIAESRHVVPFVPRTRRRFSFTLPQLAAAGIALMVLSGGLVWMAKSGDPRADFPAVDAVASADPAARTRDAGGVAPVMLADPQFQGAIEDLQRVLEQGRNRLDAETIRILEQNLATIDAAIEQSRAALEKDPANAFLNNHLAEARQRKLALLRRATALTQGS